MLKVATLALSLTVTGEGERKLILVDMGGPISIPYGVPYSAAGCVPLGGKYEITKVWSFIGSDRGDMIEADIQLSSRKLDYFYQRSEHREVPGQYDAWKSEVVSWVGDELCVQVAANVTNGSDARVHYQVRLEARPVK